ncbi:MAG: VirB8/TrbF family protein [Elusimicrobiota bacterium]|nr:VirB8/TrbF family protein [Elusimicrobiota bacterium]
MTNKIPVSETLPLGRPAYYEVWGGLESANKALWTALWLAITVAILALAMLRVQSRRPPVVIKVDGSGQSVTLSGADRQPPVGEAEVRNFLALYERFFIELNTYTYDADLRLAFTMMTPEFQSKANDQLKRENTVENLKSNQTKTTLFLTELRVLRDTPQVFECKVKGYRQVGSYKPDTAAGEVVFEHDIVLLKVPRSQQSPYGILVQDFHESVFKRVQ